MTLNGELIHKVPTKSRGINIRYGIEFRNWRACKYAGLDFEKWENGVYPAQLMAKVIAFYELDTLILQHQQEAAARKK